MLVLSFHHHCWDHISRLSRTIRLCFPNRMSVVRYCSIFAAPEFDQRRTKYGRHRLAYHWNRLLAIDRN